MRSRLYYAIGCFILSVILLFIAVPILSHILYPKVEAIKVLHEVKKGEQMTDKDLAVIEIGALDLPTGIKLTKEDVIGRYAAVELVADDVILQSKLSQLPLEGEYPKDILPIDHQAKLITIQMIEGSEYPVPETGDVVKLNRFKERLMDVPELQFVRILSVVPPESEKKEVSVTVSLNEEQQKYIHRYQEETFFASVIVRANEELAEKLLKEQELYFTEVD